ncbi:ATP-grasp domain-containing protein [Caulobacter sp. KR2-114]|uniref:ATP-grasp domain-containing protein n=1 Tax=Caulobacter sp. KR2-114 TaxID=3400912 RepID=UPI003C0C3FA9
MSLADPMFPSEPDAPDGPAPAISLGLADLAGRVFRREDLGPLAADLQARAAAAEPDLGAALDLACLLQLVGQKETGLALQADVLRAQRHFRTVHGDGSGLHLLAVCAPGDFMANTPVDFLLQGSDITLDLLYIGLDEPLPATLPGHHVALVAIGESDQSTAVLKALNEARGAWPRPALNRRTSGILNMRRDAAAELLADEPSILAPATTRAPRESVFAIAAGLGAVGDLLPGQDFPIIVRPVGSHAGGGLERIDDAAALAEYLAGQEADAFYLAPFIDYRSVDGLYRKYRVVFVAGQPFLAHLAISQHWMVHYLNAGMLEDPAKRMEEAQAMATFDDGFAARHAEAFEALNDRFALDYFGVDCAETPDGRLLVFEADNALIIHDMDPPDIFPYKSAVVRRLFDAFQNLLKRTAGV